MCARLVLFVISLLLGWFSSHRFCAAQSQTSVAQDSSGSYNAGLTLVDVPYPSGRGEEAIITTAVWYPTRQAQDEYAYRLTQDYISQVALDAPVAPGEPYPLVIYIHGGFSSGFASSFFTEELARHGYVVVAPDYVDTIPPDYTQSLAFSRMRQGKTARNIQVLKAAKQWVADMNADSDFFLSYLAAHRLPQTSFIIDWMLRQNAQSSSMFYQAVDSQAIGAIGWSEGGVTILAKIGAHPDPSVQDSRIRAALLLSSPAFPDRFQRIRIPIMLMAGDDDAPAVHPENPRRLIVDQAPAQKYHLVLKDTNHFDFGNRVCGNTPLYLAVTQKPKARVIFQYGYTFFQKHLRGDSSADRRLTQADSLLAYYLYDTNPAAEGVVEFGKEPVSSGRSLGLGHRLRQRSGSQEQGGGGSSRPLRQLFQRLRNRSE